MIYKTKNSILQLYEPRFFILFIFFNLHPSQLAYSATTISGIDSLSPLRIPPPTTPPVTLSLFSIFVSLLCFVPLPVFLLFLFPFPYVQLTGPPRHPCLFSIFKNLFCFSPSLFLYYFCFPSLMFICFVS